MTTVEQLYQAAKDLPEPVLAELLDFAEFLKQRNALGKSQSASCSLLELRGGLENSVAFADAPLLIQQRLRDEWR